MKLLVILALIAVASAIPGCAYFQTPDVACFSGNGWANAGQGIPFCKAYDSPFKCSQCFPGYTGSGTCAKDPSFIDWTQWPTTSDAHVTAQGESQNCLNYYVQLKSALEENYEGSTNAYTWNYENMSCIIGGQQVCQTCKPGFRWDSTKCTACPGTAGDCLTCKDATTCTACKPTMFLSSGTCSACGTGILTCSAKDKALTCLPSFFKEGDICKACENAQTISCKNATVAEKCIDGQYLDTTTNKCVACAQDYVGTCNATAGASGILSCKAVYTTDLTKTIYKTATGCVLHPSANFCKTIVQVTGTWYCDTCFDGYFKDLGICKLPETICLFPADMLKYADACNPLTGASGQVALTFTCKAGYYKEINTNNNGVGKCRKCSNSQVNCGGNCTPDTSSTQPKCDTTVTVAGYYVTAAATAALACTSFFGAECAACNYDTGCTALLTANVSTHFLCYRKISTKNQALSKKVSCTKAYTTPPIVADDSLNGSSAVTLGAFEVTSCTSFELDPTIATQYNCTACDRAAGAQLCVVTLVNLGLTTRTNAPQKCLKGGPQAVELGVMPVQDVKFKHCLQATASNEINITSTKCILCDLTVSFAMADQAGCTAIVAGSEIAQCIKYTSATVCDKCGSLFIKTSTGSKCVTYIQFCEKYLTIATDAALSDATCDACIATYQKSADNKNCYTCASTSNCKENIINAAGTGCGCKICNPGFYVDANTQCTQSTTDKNCFIISSTMTEKFECAVCNYGFVYVAKTNTCDACNATTKNCVYTGCGSKVYINKPTTPAAAATSYSSIISFLIMTLVALMTFMI